MNPWLLSELARERRARLHEELAREHLARLLQYHPMRDRAAAFLVALGLWIANLGARLAAERAETPDCA